MGLPLEDRGVVFIRETIDAGVQPQNLPGIEWQALLIFRNDRRIASKSFAA